MTALQEHHQGTLKDKVVAFKKTVMMTLEIISLEEYIQQKG